MANIQLKIGEIPRVYDGFKDFSLSRSMEAISSVFSFSFADQWRAHQAPWPLTPQDPIEVYIDGVMVCKGYIDELTASLSNNERAYTIQGRDRTADLIDCSAPVQFGEMRNLTLLQICKKLSMGTLIPFTEGPGNYNRGPIALHKVSEGETIFDSIQEAANKVGAILIPDGKGGVIITNAGTGRAQTKLIEGENLLSLSFTRDYSKRYSNYRVAGIGKPAKPGKAIDWAPGVPGKATESTPSLPSANVIDKGVIRYRPLLIKQQGVSDSAMVKKMAEFEAKTREAKSLTIECSVQGWTQKPGVPWNINEEIQIVAPRLGLADLVGDVYIVSETTFGLTDSGGEVTQLTLLPRNAFLPENDIPKKKKDQKGIAWSREESSEVRKPAGTITVRIPGQK